MRRVSVSLLSKVTSDRVRRKGLKLYHEKFRWHIKKYFLVKR